MSDETSTSTVKKFTIVVSKTLLSTSICVPHYRTSFCKKRIDRWKGTDKTETYKLR